MARKRSPARLLLDTSAVVYLLHGHTLQRAAVREAVAGVALGELLGQAVTLLPSLAELKRSTASRPDAQGGG